MNLNFNTSKFHNLANMGKTNWFKLVHSYSGSIFL